MKSLDVASAFGLLCMSSSVTAAVPEDCKAFLAVGEAQRIDTVRLMDRYAAGFRDATDLACARVNEMPVAGDKRCARLIGADRFVQASEADKLAVLEKSCRAAPATELREITIQAMIDRM